MLILLEIIITLVVNQILVIQYLILEVDKHIDYFNVLIKTLDFAFLICFYYIFLYVLFSTLIFNIFIFKVFKQSLFKFKLFLL